MLVLLPLLVPATGNLRQLCCTISTQLHQENHHQAVLLNTPSVAESALLAAWCSSQTMTTLVNH